MMLMDTRHLRAADESLSSLVDDELRPGHARQLYDRFEYDRHLECRFMAMCVTRDLVSGAYCDLADMLERMACVFRCLSIEVRDRDPRVARAKFGAAHAVDETAALREIDWALGALPGDQRRTLCLVNIEQLSYADAAEVLDTTRAAIGSRMARARASLIERLWISTVVMS